MPAFKLPGGLPLLLTSADRIKAGFVLPAVVVTDWLGLVVS